MNMTRTMARWWLVVILLVAAGLRLYHLANTPTGLHPDEALYAYEGWSIDQTGCDYRHTGCPPLYLKGYSTAWDNRTSVLYPYIYAGLWRIAPQTTFFVRLPSVIFGLLLVLVVYAVGRQLRPDRPLVGLLAAAFTAAAPMAISWSRLGHDVVTLPLIASSIILAALASRQRPAWWVTVGALAAVGLYSYQPLKLVGPALVLLSLWYVWPTAKKQLHWIAASLMTGTLLALPMIVTQLTHWSTVQGEFHSINIWHFPPVMQRVMWNLGGMLMSFFLNPRLCLTAVTVAAAVFVIAWKAQARRDRLFLGGWLIIAMLPAEITLWAAASNELQSRILGVVGPLELAAALTVVWLIDTRARWVRWRWRAEFLVPLLLLFGLAQVSWTSYLNHVRSGWCCFTLGGMEEVIAFVDQPRYRQRPVVIGMKNFMQGVNLLWLTKYPPKDLSLPGVAWGIANNGTEGQEEYPGHVGRYSLCPISNCYRVGDEALYLVPVGYLTDHPALRYFNVFIEKHWERWKIVDNARLAGQSTST